MVPDREKHTADNSVLVASEKEMEELLRELLKEGKRVRVQVRGYSMLPFLWNRNEAVEMDEPIDSELIPGTLVVFVDKDRFLVHRILERMEDLIVIAGDGNYNLREVVNREQVLGIVRKIIYPGGTILATDSKKWRCLSKAWLLLKPFCKWIISLFKRIARRNDN